MHNWFVLIQNESMIKYTEVRIGNLVNKNGQSAPINAGDFLKVDLGAKELKEIEPIPLTSECLERCGFCLDNKLIRLHEEEVHYSYRNNKLELTFTVAYVKDLTGADITRIRIRIDGDILFVPKAIVYVHQLQNLYFALTGEELTIKE